MVFGRSNWRAAQNIDANKADEQPGEDDASVVSQDVSCVIQTSLKPKCFHVELFRSRALAMSDVWIKTACDRLNGDRTERSSGTPQRIPSSDGNVAKASSLHSITRALFTRNAQKSHE